MCRVCRRVLLVQSGLCSPCCTGWYIRLQSSRMWHHVVRWAGTEILEKSAASIFRLEGRWRQCVPMKYSYLHVEMCGVTFQKTVNLIFITVRTSCLIRFVISGVCPSKRVITIPWQTWVVMEITVFWDVTSCCLVGRYQNFGGIWWLLLQGHWRGSRFFQCISSFMSDYRVPHYGGHWSS
jgi:hypothetical protein